MKALAKLRHNLRQCLNVCFFFSLFFYIYFRNKHDIRLTDILIAFVCLYLLTGLSSPRNTFIKLKAYHQIQFFLLDSICICEELVNFLLRLLCKFYTILKFTSIDNKSVHHILFKLWGEISLNTGILISSLKQKEST